ncbi:MAG: hypothetical protein UCV58_14890 [Clostridium saudiense]|nr:hypothetical protein [Clostridium saudiense]
MVLALIIIIGLVLLWVIISPCFEKIGEFIRRYYEKIFNEQGDEKNENR